MKKVHFKTDQTMTAEQKRKIYRLNGYLAFIEKYEAQPNFKQPSPDDPRLVDGNKQARYANHDEQRYFFACRMVRRAFMEVTLK